MTKVIPLEELLTVHKNKQFLPNYQRFKQLLNKEQPSALRYQRLAKKIIKDYRKNKINSNQIIFQRTVFRVLRKCYLD